MMYVERSKEALTIRVESPDEMRRLAVALQAGYGAVSRAEYFIRTGLSEPEVAVLSDTILAVRGSR